MAMQLSQPQRNLLEALETGSTRPHAHSATWRVLIERRFVTPRRQLTAAGRRMLAFLRNEEARERRWADAREEFAAQARAAIPAAPEPVPPTPAELERERKARELWSQTEALHSLFWQRESWTNPSLYYAGRHVVDVMVLLQAMMDAGLVVVEQKPIPANTLERSAWLAQSFHSRYAHDNRQDETFYRRCQWRRGGAGLKEMSWSAYRELRRSYPGEAIETLPDIPFAVYAPTCHAAIMAGNLDAYRALRIVTEYSIGSFGIVGYRPTEYDAVGRYVEPDSQGWQLNRFIFSERALEQLRCHFGM